MLCNFSVATADLSDVQRQAELAKSNLDKVRARVRIRLVGGQLPERVMGKPLPHAYSRPTGFSGCDGLSDVGPAPLAAEG